MFIKAHYSVIYKSNIGLQEVYFDLKKYINFKACKTVLEIFKVFSVIWTSFIFSFIITENVMLVRFVQNFKLHQAHQKDQTCNVSAFIKIDIHLEIVIQIMR